MIFFGTDGIRGKVGKDLDSETIFKAGKALGSFKNCPKILIGKDNRPSSDYVESLFVSGLLSMGANVVNVGIVSTPMVAYLTSEFNYDYGVMISASHNPYNYNGIKIFNSSGRKLFSEEEKNIESLMKKDLEDREYGSYKTNYTLKERYFRYLKKIGTNLKGLSILLDCSNGATSGYSKEIFSYYGAKVYLTNSFPNGKNINVNAGILNPSILLKKKIELGVDYALAFDGDGDRLHIIDKYNNILTGDELLYFLTKFFKIQNKIKSVVGTTQTNLGIEKSLNSQGINLLRCDVGDKNIIKEMLEKNIIIGAERSGHIIIKDYLLTGDGILSGIVLLGILEKFYNSDEYQNIYKEIKIVPQIELNYEYQTKNILEKSNITNYLEKIKKENIFDTRIVIRKSGTENVIRIVVEGQNKEKIKDLSQSIYDFLKENDN